MWGGGLVILSVVFLMMMLTVAFACPREAVLTRSLRKLREQIVRANLLVQEAGFIAEELDKRTEYRVTLQIPAANLNANRKVHKHTHTEPLSTYQL